MISEYEQKLLNELKKIKLLDSDNEDEEEMEQEIEEKIGRYEHIIFELSQYNNVEVIPYLCNIADDQANEQSSVEYLVKTIVNIINNDIANGIRYVIEGTMLMIPKAYYKAKFLHTLIIRQDAWNDVYIRILKNSTEREKEMVKRILLDLSKKDIEREKIDKILNNI